MEAAQLVLPTIATLALGTALLVPLRDDRRGKRATLHGVVPLRPDFQVIAPMSEFVAPNDAPSLPSTATGDDPGHTSLPCEDTASDDVRADFEAAGAGDPPVSIVSDLPLSRDPANERPASTETDASLPRVDTINDVSQDAGRNCSVAGETSATVRAPSRVSLFFQRLRHLFARTSRDMKAARGVGVQAGTDATNASGGDVAEPVEVASPGSLHIERSFASELAQLLTPGAPSSAAASDTANDEPASSAVVARIHAVQDRVVPLTRLPLRPQTRTVTWPAGLEPARIACAQPERHAILSAFARAPAGVNATIIANAYAQEDDAGRLLALRALARIEASPQTRATFVEALRTGTDDERTIALDALTEHGERGDLIPGLRDRVEAIAAQAALAYVASHRRADYRELLIPHIDAARIESILVLLAGAVE